MRTIMITGAGSGIGWELSQRSIARGDTVIACVLNEAEANQFQANTNLHIVQMDVGDTRSVEAGFAKADQILDGQPLKTVIHCAGVSPSSAMEVQPIDQLESVLNINALGTARMLQQSLPRLRGHNGRIILLSSLWGKVGGPLLSAYCSSKHAIEAMVDSTRREISGQSMHLILVEPGVVKTNMLDVSLEGARKNIENLDTRQAQNYGPLYKSYAELIAREGPKGTDVMAAADVIEKAANAAKPKTRYRIGKDAKAVIALSWLLPDRALDAIFKKMYGG